MLSNIDFSRVFFLVKKSKFFPPLAPHKDVIKLILIDDIVITQNEFELKSVTQLSLACVTNFTIEKLPRNSIFLCDNTNSNLLTSKN